VKQPTRLGKRRTHKVKLVSMKRKRPTSEVDDAGKLSKVTFTLLALDKKGVKRGVSLISVTKLGIPRNGAPWNAELSV
jgi:hypothetical protein